LFLVAAATPLLHGGSLPTFLHVDAQENVPEGTGTVSCIRDTGGTCKFSECSADRGPTVCDRVCFCKPDYCSTASGRCAQKESHPVAAAFTLRNARHSDQFLTLTTAGTSSNGTIITADRGDSDRMLSLHALPVEHAQDEGGYLVASSDGSHALGCSDFLRPNGCTANSMAVASASMYNIGVRLKLAPPYDWEPPGVQSLVVEFVAMGNYLFVDPFGQIIGSEGVSGVEYIWIADPPLPGISLRYDGPKCAFDCGAYGSGKAGAKYYMGIAFAVACLAGAVYMCVPLILGDKSPWQDRSPDLGPA